MPPTVSENSLPTQRPLTLTNSPAVKKTAPATTHAACGPSSVPGTFAISEKQPATPSLAIVANTKGSQGDGSSKLFKALAGLPLVRETLDLIHRIRESRADRAADRRLAASIISPYELEDSRLVSRLHHALLQQDPRAAGHIDHQLHIISRRPLQANLYFAGAASCIAEDDLTRMGPRQICTLVNLAIQFGNTEFAEDILRRRPSIRAKIFSDLLNNVGRGDYRSRDLYERFAYLGTAKDSSGLLRAFQPEAAMWSYSRFEGNLKLEDLKHIAQSADFEIGVRSRIDSGIVMLRGSAEALTAIFPGEGATSQFLHNHPGQEAYLLPSGSHPFGRNYKSEYYGSGDLFHVHSGLPQYITSHYGVTTYQRSENAVVSDEIVPGVASLVTKDGKTVRLQADDVGTFSPEQLAPFVNSEFTITGLVGPNRQLFDIHFIPWSDLESDPKLVSEIGLDKFMQPLQELLIIEESGVKPGSGFEIVPAAIAQQRNDLSESITRAASLSLNPDLTATALPFLAKIADRSEGAGIVLASIFIENPQSAVRLIESSLSEAGNLKQKRAAVEALEIIIPYLEEHKAIELIGLIASEKDSTIRESTLKLLGKSQLSADAIDIVFTSMLASPNFEKESLLVAASRLKMSDSAKLKFFNSVFESQASFDNYHHRSKSQDAFGYAPSTALNALIGSNLPWAICVEVLVRGAQVLDPQSLGFLTHGPYGRTAIAHLIGTGKIESLIESLTPFCKISRSADVVKTSLEAYLTSEQKRKSDSKQHSVEIEDLQIRLGKNYNQLPAAELAQRVIRHYVAGEYFGQQLDDAKPEDLYRRGGRIGAVIDHCLESLVPTSEREVFIASLVENFGIINSQTPSNNDRQTAHRLATSVLSHSADSLNIQSSLNILMPLMEKTGIIYSLNASGMKQSLFERILEHAEISDRQKFEYAIRGLEHREKQFASIDTGNHSTPWVFKKLGELNIPLSEKLEMMQQHGLLEFNQFYDAASLMSKIGLSAFASKTTLNDALSYYAPEYRLGLIELVRGEISRHFQ